MHHPTPEKFWLVWNPEGRQPMREHDTQGSANAEAERLAGQNEGKTFYVLEAMSHFRREAPVRRTDLVEVPF